MPSLLSNNVPNRFQRAKASFKRDVARFSPDVSTFVKDVKAGNFRAAARDVSRVAADAVSVVEDAARIPVDAAIAATRGSLLQENESLPQRKQRQRRRRDGLSGNDMPAVVAPPQPLLVGVEPNPGPAKRGQLKTVKRRVVKMARAQSTVSRQSRKALRNGQQQTGAQMQAVLAPVNVGYTYMNRPKFQGMKYPNTEFISEIYSTSAAYAVQNTLQVNPGLISSFPMAASLAANFEAYEFLSLEFFFVPGSATTVTGNVMMNFDYNPQEEGTNQFPSEQGFLDYSGSVTGLPWGNETVLRVRCPNLEGGSRVRTIRTGPISGQYDLHVYDHGQFNLATTAYSGATTTSLGKLFACYVIKFSRPRLGSMASSPGIFNGDYFSNITTGSTWNGGGASSSAAHLFGQGSAGTASFSGSVGSNVNITYINVNSAAAGSNSTLAFQQNNSYVIGQNTYAIWFNVVGSVLVGNSGVVQANTTASGYTIISNSSAAVNAAATDFYFTAPAIVQMTGTSLNLVVNLLASATTVTNVYMSVYQIPYSGVSFGREDRLSRTVHDDVIRSLQKLGLTQENVRNFLAGFSEGKSLSSGYIQIEEEEKCDDTDIIVRGMARPASVLPIKSWDTVSNKSQSRR